MTTDQRAGRLLLAALILLMLLAACNQREDTRATDSLTSAPVAQATLPAASETATPLAAAVVTTSTRPPSPTPALPTATPAPTETPSPTATPAPTETPTITPTPTEPAPVLPAWLTYLNQFRAMAGLAALEELEPLNKGSQFHSRYMVLNDAPVAHSEDPANPYYSEDGDRAARNSNIFATYMIEANYVWSTNFWISAPFHLLGILDPSLRSVGYGAYNEATGKWQMAAVLDLRSEPRPPVAEVQYPIFFPGDGAETWIVRLSLFEWPNPYASCPGYQAPTGPAIAVLLGDGDGTPRVRSQVISKDGAPLDSCVFDETSYLNGDAWAQKTGRQILDNLDAVVIIPRQPLAVDNTYQVRVTTDEGTYEWQFHTRRPPEASE